jgi:ribosomal protein S18 acetylase RimI-like enzyme
VEHVIRDHRNVGLKSFLHVLTKNVRAVALYERLGFVTTRRVVVHQLERL